MKVLLPVDGSACSARAVEYVIKSAAGYREPVEVDLLTVHLPIPYQNAIAAIGKDQVNRYYEEEGVETLKPLRAKLDAARIANRPHVMVGEPADVIAEHAKRTGVDQIVMGTHGRGQIGTALLGSVAAKVIHRSPVPVVLIK